MTWPPPPDVRLPGRLVEVAPAVTQREAEELFRALDDDRVWQHLAGRPRRPQAVAERLEQRRAAGGLPWIVRLRTGYAGLPAGTVVGTSTYLDVSVVDARLEIGGTAYTPGVWGTAVNPDTKLALLTHAFEVLGAGRVQLKTDVRNTRSQGGAEHDKGGEHRIGGGEQPRQPVAGQCPDGQGAPQGPADVQAGHGSELVGGGVHRGLSQLPQVWNATTVSMNP